MILTEEQIKKVTKILDKQIEFVQEYINSLEEEDDDKDFPVYPSEEGIRPKLAWILEFKALKQSKSLLKESLHKVSINDLASELFGSKKLVDKLGGAVCAIGLLTASPENIVHLNLSLNSHTAQTVQITFYYDGYSWYESEDNVLDIGNLSIIDILNNNPVKDIRGHEYHEKLPPITKEFMKQYALTKLGITEVELQDRINRRPKP